MRTSRAELRPVWLGPALALAAALLLGACSLTAYKMDIQQGNVVTQEMVAKLRQGMTRSQVKFVMGTPLVSDPFHEDRWDYFYEFIKAGKVKDKKRLTLVFDQDRLAKVLGDVQTEPALKDGLPPAGTAKQ
ncbi:MAG: outer membrane protein assembly factor BamE [Burkholderiales bacterium]|nr:outer membrane protein assembly factor BamE [Burkholderiales bacterium]